MAKTPIIPTLPEEEHFEQELGAYNYIPNDEDDGTGESPPHQKTSNDVDDNESMDASEDKGKRPISVWTVLLVVICIVLIAMIGYIGWKAYDYYHIPAYETGNISDDLFLLPRFLSRLLIQVRVIQNRNRHQSQRIPRTLLVT